MRNARLSAATVSTHTTFFFNTYWNMNIPYSRNWGHAIRNSSSLILSISVDFFCAQMFLFCFVMTEFCKFTQSHKLLGMPQNVFIFFIHIKKMVFISSIHVDFFPRRLRIRYYKVRMNFIF